MAKQTKSTLILFVVTSRSVFGWPRRSMAKPSLMNDGLVGYCTFQWNSFFWTIEGISFHRREILTYDNNSREICDSWFSMDVMPCHAIPNSQLPSAWPKRNRDLRRLQGSIQRCSQDMKLLKCNHLMWNLNPTRKWSNSWSNSSLSPSLHNIYIIYIYT